MVFLCFFLCFYDSSEWSFALAASSHGLSHLQDWNVLEEDGTDETNGGSSLQMSADFQTVTSVLPCFCPLP